MTKELMQKNKFCVISKATYGDYEKHDIQTNSAWSENPYGDDYVIVPTDMVEDILLTQGYCDITLNEDETEVVSFVAREIPQIDIVETPSQLDVIEAQVTYTAMMTDTLLEV